MASKAASLAELHELHRLIAQSFKSIITTDLTDGVPTDAATLGACIKFLKDNEVTADPADKEDLNELREKLKEVAAQRRPTLIADAGEFVEREYEARVA